MVKIVEVSKTDKEYIEEIVRIEEETFGKNGGVDMWLLKPLVKYGKVLVLTGEEGKVEGVAEFIKDFDENEAYIYGFAIGTSSRGKGYGGIFLEKSKEYMKGKGIERLLLTVDPKNIPAVSLYEKYGFEAKETIKDEYGKGIDRLFMVCKL